MSVGDYLILGALAVAAFFAVRHVMRGKSSCSGGCAGCPHSGGCRRKPLDPSSGGCRRKPPDGGFSALDADMPTSGTALTTEPDAFPGNPPDPTTDTPTQDR